MTRITTRLVMNWDGDILEEDSHEHIGDLALMSGGGDAPTPDPNIGIAALQTAQEGQDYLNWAQSAYAAQQPQQQASDQLSDQLSQAQLQSTQQANTQSAAQWARYNSTYAPEQDQYASDAANYASTANQDAAASEAAGDVNKSYSAQSTALNQNMARMGINPSSGAYQQNNVIANNSQALASATAQTAARTNVRNTGLSLEGSVAQLGQSIVGGANSTSSTGTSAAGTSANIADASNASNIAANGIVSSGYQGAMQGSTTEGQMLNSEYQNQLSGYQAANQATSGLFAGLGTIATAGATVY